MLNSITQCASFVTIINLLALTPDDLLPIARLTAEALHAAHQAGVLHRDVKPGNLLVRKTATGWEIRLIDFGLSLRRSLVQSSLARAATHNRSMVGSAVAGTLDYAAPEQLDPASSRLVGPHSDVYGFGRTCLFALFGTTQPRSKRIRGLPDPWPDLLDDCCDKEIKSRPPDFAVVLERLNSRPAPKPTPAQLPRAVTLPPWVARALMAMAGIIVIVVLTQLGGWLTASNGTKPLVSPTHAPAPAKLVTNSIGMQLVGIEPGEFLMGSPESDTGAFSDEKPQHRVRITKAFSLGIHEVTQGQYQAVMGETPSSFKGSDDLPVENVSWLDAIKFCNRLSEREQRVAYYRIDGADFEVAGGNGYRLPTEAEWEYACRAGSATVYPFGNDAGNLGEHAWYDSDSASKTHPVGQKRPNAWGLYDMLCDSDVSGQGGGTAQGAAERVAGQARVFAVVFSLRTT
jgi:serine/threonine protein kinase